MAFYGIVHPFQGPEFSLDSFKSFFQMARNMRYKSVKSHLRLHSGDGQLCMLAPQDPAVSDLALSDHSEFEHLDPIALAIRHTQSISNPSVNLQGSPWLNDSMPQHMGVELLTYQ